MRDRVGGATDPGQSRPRRDPGFRTVRPGTGRTQRYRIVHRTTFRYEAPVSSSRNEARLHPRDTAEQRCSRWELVTDPAPSHRSQYLDDFGNIVDAFSVEGPFCELDVTASSRVVVTSRETPTSSIPWEAARDRLLAPDLEPDLAAARPFCGGSDLVALSPGVHAYAARSFPAGRPLVDAALDLTARIAADFTYDPGFTTITTPLDDVLRFRRGVCQDFAQLAAGCVRSMGLAARYVSGYLETSPPPGHSRRLGADASHAWVAVLVPDEGWFDLDPTNDAVVGDTHVTTAWGRDYADVAPVTGVIVGGQTGTLEVAVDVAREDPAA